MTKDYTWDELLASTVMIQGSEENWIDIFINILQEI